MATATDKAMTEEILEPGDGLDRDLTVIRHLRGTRKVDLYLCHSRRLKKQVACKALRPEHRSRRRALRAVRQEGEILQRLEHPNLVHGYGFEMDDRPRIVMEYLEGQTVKDAFLTGNFEAFGIGDIVGVVEDVSDALSYVHSQGLLHLDVKPANVMNLDGRSVLFDFSVAKYCSPEHPLKDDAGTVEYMAPEQTNYEEVSYATDIFGLGVLFYQLLCGGALPYPEVTRQNADSNETTRVLDYEETPPHPSDLNSDIPRCIADVAMTAIEPNPASRYATALDLKEALLGAIEQAEAALLDPGLAMVPA